MFQKKNFAKGELSAQLLIGGTSLVLDTDQGALFPDTGSGNIFKGVIWGSTFATPFDDTSREVVEAYRSSGDTFTIVRAEEGTTAKQWEIGDNFMLTATAEVLQELETTKATGTEIDTKTDDSKFVTSKALDDQTVLLKKAGGTMTGSLVLATGTTTVAPIKMVAGTNLTTPEAGVIEFDGSDFYLSI